ncbi:hypothetical protein C1752_07463 [Acaryochloris thomasi RCC1774]|uniref:Uncharacterized protein n=1 Tax=Acaryochloris thomasi RCC1774 TaxID=1764569 RepID=A0A2W1JQJ9_9CYAN|nr:hypothetical protein [Acaryochloris thomasi]PZD71187.1 hypothetical protein C1752_07463 [Acaryochloris thomasi RCC1774]
MSSSDKYKQQIMEDLADGNVESLGGQSSSSSGQYDNFDDFAQRSSRDERRNIFSQMLHPSKISHEQMEPELKQAINKIKPNERDDVAREFFKQLKERGLSDRQLEKQLHLSTHNPKRMKADDVGKLASFAYHSHPDIFQEVMADQPALMKFLSNPMVGAIMGAVASKWMGKHH